MLFLILSPAHVWSGQNKHQQSLLLPFRGFSSACANQMMKQNKNVDFIFYMCVTESPTRNKYCMCLCEAETAGQCETSLKKKDPRLSLLELWRLLQAAAGSAGRRTGMTGGWRHDLKIDQMWSENQTRCRGLFPEVWAANLHCEKALFCVLGVIGHLDKSVAR